MVAETKKYPVSCKNCGRISEHLTDDMFDDEFDFDDYHIVDGVFFVDICHICSDNTR